MTVVQRFLLIEAAAFALAALISTGYVVQGFQHRAARTAEGILAAVLAAGLVISVRRPAWTRRAGLAAQGIGLAGTLIGVLTTIVGVGPQSRPDMVYHAVMVALLSWGLITTARAG
jgi:hypothetical protein